MAPELPEPVRFWSIPRDHNVLYVGIEGKGVFGNTDGAQTWSPFSVSYKNDKARFRVSWMGEAGTTRSGQMGVESVDSAKCIWDAATLSPTAADTCHCAGS